MKPGLRSERRRSPRAERVKPRAWLRTALSPLLFIALPPALCAADKQSDRTDGDAAAELQRLDGIWRHWSDNIKSLKVEGHHFFGSQKAKSNSFLRRDLERLIKETVIPALELGDRDQDALSRLTTPIFAKPGRKNGDGAQPPTGGWRPFRFIESAGKRRQEIKLLSTIARVRKDGTEQVYQQGAKQVSLYPSHSSVFMADIAHFVYVPNSAKRKLSWSLARADGTGHLTSPGAVLEYDERTGFVERYVDRASDNWYLLERYQAMPVQTSAGVPVAQFIAEATFWQGGDGDAAPVHWLNMYVFDTIEVNGTVDPSEFALAVPAGTNIVKFDNADNNHPPERGSRPPMRLAEQPVSDAAAFFAASGAGTSLQRSAEAGSSPPGHPPGEPPKSAWNASRIGLIAVNVAVLLGAIAWARRKK